MYLYQQYRRTQPRTPRHHRLLASALFVMFLVSVLGAANYFRPLPSATASTLPTNSDVNTVQLNWPPNTQSALGAINFGELATHGPQSPVPTASLAKIITALTILQKKPLTPGQQGPTLTLTDADVALYNHYLSEDGAVAKVQAGEQITELQALQAMILVSANNMADTLAIWAFGSLPNYQVYANKLVKQWGLAQTTIGSDASGFLPNTTSTAHDLIALAQRSLRQPIMVNINAISSIDIPVAGTIKNGNQRLGRNGIRVLKGGLTDQAGGCLLFKSTTVVNGQAVILIGALLGAHDLGAAVDGATKLAASAKPNFIAQTLVTAGQRFGTVTTPWGESAPLMAQTNVTIVAWKGAAVTPHLELTVINHAMDLGEPIGAVVVNSKGNRASSPITIGKAIAAPPFAWRLLRH